MFRRFRLAAYVLLGCVSILGCLLVSPGFARFSIASTAHTEEVPIAQSAPTDAVPAATAEQLEQIARENYAAKQFREAAIAFQQAAQTYEGQGNPLRQAMSLSNLSLADQQLGSWVESAQAISTSLAILEAQQQNSLDWQSAYAQALDIRAKLELSQGQAARASATWERAAAIHSQLGHMEQASESQINQARALQNLGLYSRAIIVLQTALKLPEQPMLLEGLADIPEQKTAIALLEQRLQILNASASTVAALQSLGEALQVVGNLGQAHIILRYSLTQAETLMLPDAIASVQLSLGNLIRVQAIADLRLSNLSVQQAVAQLQKQLSPIQQELQYRQTRAAQKFDDQTREALAAYQQAADRSGSDIQVQAHLNRLNLLLDTQQETEAEATIAQIDPLLNRLPPTRKTIDAHLSFAQSLRRMAAENFSARSGAGSSAARRFQAAQLLATARQQAIALGDSQAESYALGGLGELYEQTQQWTEAATLTQQALEKVNAVSVTNLPYAVNDADLAYRWHYQLGRIRAAQDDRAGAIAAYETAAKILQERLSLDVASSNLSYQFSFNATAQQPVHQDWMDLLLQSTPSQLDLQQVRQISTALLQAQLTSFLQEPCAVVSPQQVDKIVEESAQKTAIFYPVILPDRLEVVVKLPGDTELYHYRQAITREQLLAKLSSLQIALEEGYTFEAVKTLSHQLYDWLVEPVEPQLKAKQIDTLVFTLDRRLQSIPMAALYDGEQYLIEKYAVSEILGLQFDSSDRSLQPGQLKVIGAGLSTAPVVKTVGGEDVQGLFLPLNYVKDELEAIQGSGIQATTLLNKEFTLANFNTRLNEEKFPVVHLATHGQFSFDPKRTFLLTYDEKPIDVDDLSALFRVRGQIRLDAIELLIVNACETAAGDDLATLGIAGAAVRAGARSAIASLWTLDDAPSVTFSKILYQNLQKPDISKAEALRQAQIALLQDPRYQHPRYWSSYILTGNWLPLTTSRSVGSAGA